MTKPRYTLHDIWTVEGTRWAELLLASVKIALGTDILTSIGSPAVTNRFGPLLVLVTEEITHKAGIGFQPSGRVERYWPFVVSLILQA